MEYGVLDYDVLRQQIPFFIYRRLLIDKYNKVFYFNPEIPIGFCFLLRRVHFKGAFDVEGGLLESDYRIEFVRSLRGRLAQNLPLPMDLFSTPGWSDAAISPAPMPVDNNIFGRCFSDLPQVKNLIILNYLYQHRETVECRVRHHTTVSPEEMDFYIDILLDGYFLPESVLGMWK